MSNRIQIFDTTLRDGEQVPGCQLNREEKVEVALELEKLGVEKKVLCQTMLDLYQYYSMIVEPAGALSVAALEQLRPDIEGKTVVCVISGGNFDTKRFPEISQLAKS